MVRAICLRLPPTQPPPCKQTTAGYRPSPSACTARSKWGPATPPLAWRWVVFIAVGRPWLQALCAVFGAPSFVLASPASTFAQPFGPRHVAVVQVADQPRPTGPTVLGFRLLVLPRRLYADLGGDP